MALINFNSLNGLSRLFSTGNDRHTTTPQLSPNLINIFNKTAQYVSIDGNEGELYRTTPQLFKVIYRKASMLANGEFIHYGKNGEVIQDSPIVKFLRLPNPVQAQNEWIIQQSIQKDVYGNAFIYFLKGSKLAEIPSALWNLSPKDVKVLRTGKIFQQTKLNEIITSYKIDINGDGTFSESFDPSQILHRNIQDVDDAVVGMSPFHQLKMPISNIRSAYGFRNVIMTEKGALGMLTNNSKNTSGALPLTEKERKSIEQQFTKSYGISDKQRKIIMTSASLKWNPMSYPTKDMMLFEEIDEDTREIIDAYGLNEALFSLGKGTTFDNQKEGEKSAYQDTIIPEGDDLAFGLSRKFGLEEKGERLEMSFDHVASLQGDQQTESSIIVNKANAIQTLINAGYSRTEIDEMIQF